MHAGRRAALSGHESNATEGSRDPLGHAELRAIQAAAAALGGWRLAGCTLYVTLEPCPMCAGAILNARLRRVVYGARSPRVGADGGWVRLLPPYPPAVAAAIGDAEEEERGAALVDARRGRTAAAAAAATARAAAAEGPSLTPPWRTQAAAAAEAAAAAAAAAAAGLRWVA